ncbi:PREDICTED: urotensin-2B [Capra hircus]|uniref:urotensin-2B n=1 Tax=Capra hircus TaxID=9925 RepID=UPI0008471505|nr:PREDICTED: urotensin-2B [Capra hircus]
MNVILSTTLCFGLLTLLSVMIFLESVHGLPYFIQGNELLPDKEDTDGEELLLALLNKNFGFQRSSNTDIELANKLEEPNQLEILKEQLTEAKDAEMSYAIDGLSSSHPNKREVPEEHILNLNCYRRQFYRTFCYFVKQLFLFSACDISLLVCH